MRFYLLSDNTDTALGMRLAGIEGEVIHGVEQLKAALDKIVASQSKSNFSAQKDKIGAVLISHSLFKLCPDYITALKKANTTPIFSEIPDRDGDKTASTFALEKAVKEATGISI